MNFLQFAEGESRGTSVFEIATATDTVSAVVRATAITETAAAAATFTATQRFQKSVAEAAVALATFSATVGSTIVDTPAAALDAPSATMTFLKPITEMGAAVDTVAISTMGFLKPIVEAAVAVDTVAGVATQVGANWTLRTLPTTGSEVYVDIKFGGGLFIAMRNGVASTSYLTSPDGITWTARSFPSIPYPAGLSFANGLWFAGVYGGVSTPSNQMMTSPDGINWTARTMPSSWYAWTSVAYGNGVYVATNSSVSSAPSNKAATSTDGFTWTDRTLTHSANNGFNVSFGNGVFIAYASDLTVDYCTSTDGITWTRRTWPVFGLSESGYQLDYQGGKFIVIGFSGSTGNKALATSPDGITWTVQNTNILTMTYFAFGKSNYVMVSNPNGTVSRSLDAVTWTNSNLLTNSAWTKIAFGNSTFVALVNLTASYATST